MDSIDKTAFHAGGIIIVLLVFLIGMIIPCSASENRVDNDFGKIPRSLVFMPDHTNAVLVEKSTQRIFLYSSDKKIRHKIFGFVCSTGESPGVKSKSGDRKTPEGVYFFNHEYEDRYLAPVYGKKAFATDYPNFLDRLAGRDGSAIWLHGTNKKLKPRGSNGCVAMDNSDLLDISKYISLNLTPMVIVNKIVYVDKQSLDSAGNGILEMLGNWITSLEKGDYHDYLSFYDSGYLPDMSWWPKWRKIRGKVEKKGLFFKLNRAQAGIYRTGKVFVTLCDLGLELAGKHMEYGKKEFFIRKIHGKYKIIGDQFQTLPGKIVVRGNPLNYAADRLVMMVRQKYSFSGMVAKWLRAWSSKDMIKYANFYSEKFHSDGMNKERWIARKKRLARKYYHIYVSGDNIKIHRYRKKTIVTFFQVYKATGFTARGIKKLVLVKEGNLWKIYRETWQRK